MAKNKINETFIKEQHTFTQHIRDPEHTPAPEGIESRRISIYTDLIFRNIENFIANSFPVLRQVIHDDEWHIILRGFLKKHISRTPYFPKLPLEFLNYLEQEQDEIELPAFCIELAHYEWIEISLSFDPREISLKNVDQNGDLLKGIPVLSLLAQPHIYQWPVHKISSNFVPKEKPYEPTYLIVYRDHLYDVGFIELNQIAAKLIEELQKNTDKTGEEILLDIAKQLQHPDPKVVIKGGFEVIQDFKKKDILLGVRNNI
jgi:hypothetical protein